MRKTKNLTFSRLSIKIEGLNNKNNFNKKIQIKQGGITLIALVITIALNAFAWS